MSSPGTAETACSAQLANVEIQTRHQSRSVVRNLRLVVQYDGSQFAGWQTQPGRRTVQQILETAIQTITCEERIRLNPSGRTDAGVHARGQVVNFYSRTQLPCEVLVKAINSQLPADLSIRFADDMTQSFCSNKDANQKTYQYLIYHGRTHDPFLRHYAFHSRHELKVEAMKQAGQILVGRHDFRSFETDWPNRLSSVRTVSSLTVESWSHCVLIQVTADGFLYNMVRAIAGTLIQIGRGYWPVEQIHAILASGDRQLAGPTAPPQGLTLLHVEYREPYQLPCFSCPSMDRIAIASDSLRG